MKVKKINANQALPGIKVILKGETSSLLAYSFNMHGSLDMAYSNFIIKSFNYDEVTIITKPKNYQGSGKLVRFAIPNTEGSYLLFWSNFKELIDTTIEQRKVNIDNILDD